MNLQNPNRTKRLEIRVSMSDLTKFRAAAKAAGESHTGTWLRKVGLEAARELLLRGAQRPGRRP